MHLVSTQLIEAGVDIDFPIAFRALGPLDSIIQTAGRCNREGNSATPCPVIVFRPIDGGLPPGSYSVAAKKTEEFLNRHPNAEDLLHDPEFYAQYFRELYNIVKGEDKVLKASKAFNFPLAYNECQVIDNNTQSVLVPWERGKYFISKLEREHHLKPSEYREAQKYSVNLYEGEFTNGRTHGFIYQPSDNADLFAWSSKYDEDLGACHPEAKDLVIA